MEVFCLLCLVIEPISNSRQPPAVFQKPCLNWEAKASTCICWPRKTANTASATIVPIAISHRRPMIKPVIASTAASTIGTKNELTCSWWWL